MDPCVVEGHWVASSDTAGQSHITIRTHSGAISSHSHLRGN